MRIKNFKFNGEDKVLFWCCFNIRRVMGAMLRTYQITMGRAYYKCTLRFSSTSNVTDTVFELSVGAHPPSEKFSTPPPRRSAGAA